MGIGIELARELAPEHADLMDNLKDQLLIVFLRRLGGEASVPVGEVDDTGGDMLLMNLRDGVFNFALRKKS